MSRNPNSINPVDFSLNTFGKLFSSSNHMIKIFDILIFQYFDFENLSKICCIKIFKYLEYPVTFVTIWNNL